MTVTEFIKELQELHKDYPWATLWIGDLKEVSKIELIYDEVRDLGYTVKKISLG